MSEESNESTSSPQVNINDYTPSTAEKFREQAKRVQERKERSADIIDDVWNDSHNKPKEPVNVPGTVEVEDHGRRENTANDDNSPRATDNNERSESTEKTFDDVVDEVWDSQNGEQEAEEASEDQSGDEQEDINEVDGPEEAEEEFDGGEVGESRDDIILATIEGEDGAEQIEIPKDAKITVKVDGEEQEVSLQEFANGISGQKAISQKFSALNGEQKAFETRLQNWNETSAKAVELMNDNKAVEAIQHVAEMMGQDPQLLFTGLFEEITPVLNDYANLSESERDVWVQDLKNKKAEFKAKSAQDELNKLRAAQEQQVQVKNAQEAYGLDEATFTHAYHALEAEMDAGTLSKQPITPELVGEYSNLVKIEGYATEALVGTEHEGNQVAINQLLQAVNQMARNGVEISEQSVKDLVSEALGRQQQIDKSKSVNKSLKKKGVKPKAKGGKKPGKKVQRNNPSDVPQNWMTRAIDELENGSSAADLGLASNKKRK